ncbi:MAG: hypothetical protein QOK48_1751, partial [Blastocatellia bacterium]|nr:hypothetical protein [Blastocatellia bacterium]
DVGSGSVLLNALNDTAEVLLFVVGGNDDQAAALGFLWS